MERSQVLSVTVPGSWTSRNPPAGSGGPLSAACRNAGCAAIAGYDRFVRGRAAAALSSHPALLLQVPCRRQHEHRRRPRQQRERPHVQGGPARTGGEKPKTVSDPTRHATRSSKGREPLPGRSMLRLWRWRSHPAVEPSRCALARLRRIAALSLLLLLVGAATALPAQAQSEVTLVKNTGQTNNSNHTLETDSEDDIETLGLSFDTGNHPEGYRISEIKVDANVSFGAFDVFIVQAGETIPNDAYQSFSRPSSFGNKVHTFSARSTPNFRRNTEYTIAIRVSGGLSLTIIKGTSSTGEDTGGNRAGGSARASSWSGRIGSSL